MRRSEMEENRLPGANLSGGGDSVRRLWQSAVSQTHGNDRKIISSGTLGHMTQQASLSQYEKRIHRSQMWRELRNSHGGKETASLAKLIDQMIITVCCILCLCLQSATPVIGLNLYK
jgi:hypothetical protein